MLHMYTQCKLTCKPRKSLKPCLTFYPTYDWKLAFHIYIERESSLVEINRLSRDSHLARGDNHMSLEIVLQNKVSEGNWKFFVSYSFQSPIGIILLTDDFFINDRIVFQKLYIFKLNKSSKNSTDRDCIHQKALR